MPIKRLKKSWHVQTCKALAIHVNSRIWMRLSWLSWVLDKRLLRWEKSSSSSLTVKLEVNETPQEWLFILSIASSTSWWPVHAIGFEYIILSTTGKSWPNFFSWRLGRMLSMARGLGRLRRCSWYDRSYVTIVETWNGLKFIRKNSCSGQLLDWLSTVWVQRTPLADATWVSPFFDLEVARCQKPLISCVVIVIL